MIRKVRDPVHVAEMDARKLKRVYRPKKQSRPGYWERFGAIDRAGLELLHIHPRGYLPHIGAKQLAKAARRAST